MSKYKNISSLVADEDRVYRECQFSHICKNEGKRFYYDFKKYSYYHSCPEIVQVFSWAVYKKRNSQGHNTRVSTMEAFSYFSQFLEIRGIRTPDKLNANELKFFSQWLKHSPNLKYSTSGSLYRKLASTFRVMSNHPLISKEFIPVKNGFPKSEQVKEPQLGFSESEFKKILKAVTSELRESSKRLEKKYERVWIGETAPIDDVAPFEERDDVHWTGSKWVSEEYRLWWWENVAGCQKLHYDELKKLKGGREFYNRLKPTPNRNVITKLSNFYEEIGAGKNYKPKYLGKKCPIIYSSPWQKKEYVMWYWENKLDCIDCTFKDLKDIDRKFYSGVQWNFGTFDNIRKEVNAGYFIHGKDLYPYFLMLLIRTGLNPSTIIRLTIDCIDVDPLDPERKMINWSKFRSYSKGQTIPSGVKNDTWPVKIIERVIDITERIRSEGQVELWLSNSSSKSGHSVAIKYPTIRNAAKKLTEKYDLKDDKGDPLNLVSTAFRPTIAWIEYLRTEDMNYLQTLLGHKRLNTTSEYLRRVKDPVFINRRAVHQEAMFLGLTEEGGGIKNISNMVMNESNDVFSEGLLGHCKDPLASPVEGQKKGQPCSSDPDVCFSCQNLVITIVDIKKYFCFMNFYQFLLDIDEITQKDFDGATGEKRHYWETYILPKYPDSIVDKLRLDANENPYEQWDTANYVSVTGG